MGNMDYDIFTKIYENTVIPVLDYASGVWGAKQYDNIERLHYRAIRTFLGVGKTTPIPAILADMGWHPVFIHNQCNVVRLWCRLMNMPGHRICRKVFVWDREMSRRYRNTWFNSAKTLLDRCNLSHLTDNDSDISTRFILDSVKSIPALLLVLLCNFAQLECRIICLSCTGLSEGEQCHNVVSCEQNEVCFTQKYRTKDNFTKYDVGCSYPELCRKDSTGVVFGKRMVDHGHVVCHQCCQDNVCNSVITCSDKYKAKEINHVCASSTECKIPKIHNASCNISTECSETLFCTYGLCKCDRIDYWTGNYCTAKNTYGHSCLSNDDCKSHQNCLIISVPAASLTFGMEQHAQSHQRNAVTSSIRLMASSQYIQLMHCTQSLLTVFFKTELDGRFKAINTEQLGNVFKEREKNREIDDRLDDVLTLIYRNGLNWDSLLNVAMVGRSAGKIFSTFDSDNDGTSKNCAVVVHSGWWYSNCEYSDLNKQNMNWVYDMGYTIKESMMMVSKEV
ncbi:unnamed protein product [Mytilus edulis]|uniref:Fibrinogen C-terminal domain-containing protein n=1 Tax=Mytilus edulis TaxID=6550 RepID=A0A8S3VED2_MYTED|nr:unnamed protein product [Mytilus edulis]